MAEERNVAESGRVLWIQHNLDPFHIHFSMCSLQRRLTFSITVQMNPSSSLSYRKIQRKRGQVLSFKWMRRRYCSKQLAQPFQNHSGFHTSLLLPNSADASRHAPWFSARKAHFAMDSHIEHILCCKLSFRKATCHFSKLKDFQLCQQPPVKLKWYICGQQNLKGFL